MSTSRSEGEVKTYRVNGMLPVIVWNTELGKRRVVPMRWSFLDPKDWRRPKTLARAETIDERQTFQGAFNNGQRGIVVFETFNEGEEVPKPSGAKVMQQWTINARTASCAVSLLSGVISRFRAYRHRCWPVRWSLSQPMN